MVICIYLVVSYIRNIESTRQRLPFQLKFQDTFHGARLTEKQNRKIFLEMPVHFCVYGCPALSLSLIQILPFKNLEVNPKLCASETSKLN